ncbi:LacI family DNA-binding transcriptional regulator [Aliiruegeria sabulilitoris]|uniref:LacI family DNA-binding transcriptional regulator n=1 Tax=Aliiruegeria sabulilitoris TaxID=1510458 RepID=UPI0009E9AEC0|nr:LacI family DNA-binding transcriptional regulator [Aliiruegeria sabulilitoris]NDR58397.1 LacI family DNA-binding transcriptional regulator [Pseudoruegeria sp. M32A2M]
MAGKRLTLADVARAAGVSKMTASRALRNAGDVSRANIEKVQQAAREIGYIGNPIAMSLSNQRTNLVGVVVPSASNIVFAEVLAGITEALSDSGFQPVIGVTDYNIDREAETIRGMLSWRPAGLIVTGLDQPEPTRQLLEHAGLPVVQIMDVDGTPTDGCVGIAQTEAGTAMARALIAQGRRRIGYIGCDLAGDTRATKRRAGFEAALAAAGVSLVGTLVSEQPSSVVAGRKLTVEFLSRHDDIDCLYYSNDDIAVGGLFHCMDAGIPVPEQILLTGFNGLDLVQALPAQIATTHTPRHEIGLKAAQLILEAADQRSNRVDRMIELPTRIDITPGFPR